VFSDAAIQFCLSIKVLFKAHTHTYVGMRSRGLVARDALSKCLQAAHHARRKLARWRYTYNYIRPHSALGNLAPAQARRALEQSEGSAPGALAPPSRAGSPEITRRLSL
jgi:putative transposase